MTVLFSSVIVAVEVVDRGLVGGLKMSRYGKRSWVMLTDITTVASVQTVLTGSLFPRESP